MQQTKTKTDSKLKKQTMKTGGNVLDYHIMLQLPREKKTDLMFPMDPSLLGSSLCGYSNHEFLNCHSLYGIWDSLKSPRTFNLGNSAANTLAESSISDKNVIAQQAGQYSSTKSCINERISQPVSAEQKVSQIINAIQLLLPWGCDCCQI